MAKLVDNRPGEAPAIPRNFIVAIDDVEFGFSSLSRLGSLSLPEGPSGDRRPPTKIAHSYENVILRRALGRDRRLFEWRENILAGKPDRRLVTIRQLDAAGRVATNILSLEGAW